MQLIKTDILAVRNISMTICEKQYKSLRNWNEFMQAQSIPDIPTQTVVSSQEPGIESKYAELLYGQDARAAVESSSQIAA